MSKYKLRNKRIVWGTLSKSIKIGLVGTIIISSISIAGCAKKDVSVETSKAQQTAVDSSMVVVSTSEIAKEETESNDAKKTTENVSAIPPVIEKVSEDTVKINVPSNGSSNTKVVTQPPSNTEATTKTTTTTTKPTTVVTPKKETTKPTSTSIKAKYGNHTYGCKTQAEYDAVISAVNSAIANKSDSSLNSGLYMYMDGERMSDYADNKESDEYIYLSSVEVNFGSFLKNVDSSHYIKIFKAGAISAKFGKAQTKNESSADSAYDAAIRKVNDCVSDAQLDSAILDTLGYSSMVRGAGGDAKCYVKVDGTWYRLVGLDAASISGGTHISEPTF